MRWGRRVLTAALAGAVPLLVPVATASPAAAHGAPDNPISRTMACAPDGPYVDSAACRAALAASDRQAFDDWDYVRVVGVAGRDREVIPDGALCSGGVAGFAGLDLPRADWPATEVEAGSAFTFSYRTTIPHRGEFRLYVTEDGYDPAEPLTWSDMEDEPFLTVTDPEPAGDAYQLPGRLPEGRSGRHVVLTVWQNFDPPDTYYACSDVIFTSPESSAPESSPPASPPSASAVTGPAAQPAGLARPARPAGGSAAVSLAIAAVATVVVVAVVAAIGLVRHRRGRRRAT